jgi:hypothetical protein
LIALSPEMSVVIKLLVADRDLAGDDRLFSMPDKLGERPVRTPTWPDGQPVGRSYFREYIWKPAHTRAGVEARRFHDLRG